MTSTIDLEFIPYTKDEFIRKLLIVTKSASKKDMKNLFYGQYSALKSKGVFLDLPDDLSRAIFFIYFRRMYSSDLLERDLDFVHFLWNRESYPFLDITVLCYDKVNVSIYLRPQVNHTTKIMLKHTHISIPQKGVHICVKEECDVVNYYNYSSILYRTICAFYYAFKLNDKYNKEAQDEITI